MSIPACTYRIQLNKDFTFDDTAKLADYFSVLGISHLYSSPCLKASPGSSHGYDVVDYSTINDELGGMKGLKWLDRRLKEKELGIVLDIVPNHMAITGQENRWWWDVLENGPSSLYSSYFDVDWEFPPELPSNKILLPILGDHYGKVIEAKEILIQRLEQNFIIRYYDHVLPASPKSLVEILFPVNNKLNSDELGFIVSALHHLPPPSLTDRTQMKSRNRDKHVIFMLLARILEDKPHIRKMIDEEIETINSNLSKLDTFLEKQNYRLSFWKTARTDLGYRRFFDINNYVALRMEDPEVFEETHRMIFTLIKKHIIQGLRIDHIDGLLDPEGYLCLLREKTDDIWTIVEKILHREETLPKSWPVAGTTGYDFMNEVSGLFVKKENEHKFTDFYSEFSGESRNYEALLYESKKQIIVNILASDLNRLTIKLLKICQQKRRYRDYSKDELSEVLSEYITQLHVYRTYARTRNCPAADHDTSVIASAIEKAKMNKENIDPALFDFLRDLCMCQSEKKIEIDFVLQLQQLTGPVMAKGMEDTLFYRYNRFVMLNEVGGDPSLFGIDKENFHKKQAFRGKKYPSSMLSTSTHDTKRSEGVRARLAVISEIPEIWKDFVIKCSHNNTRYKKNNVPENNMEYLLYQTVVGAWPISNDRLSAYVVKAAREAKVYTSWIRQEKEYEENLSHFIDSVMQDEAFLKYVDDFVSPIIYYGRINSLAMVLFKLTSPGVPDIYQGTELWDLSLVDPDNRRQIDYETRMNLLNEITEMNVKKIMERMDDGLPKLWLIHKTLSFRKQYPELFSLKQYQGISADGEKSRHIEGFLRGDDIVVVVPRLLKSMGNSWENTNIKIPEGKWLNILDEKEYNGPAIKAEDLFGIFPVSLLVRSEKISS